MNENNQETYTIEEIIASSFDFSGHSEEQRQSIIEEISSMIMEASLLRSLTDADEDTQQVFHDFMESDPSQEHMRQFIQEHFPHFQEVVVSEIETFLQSDDAASLAPKKT